MARTEKKQKIGSKTMRVKKQCVQKSKSSSPRINDAFIGISTPLYEIPLDLRCILEKYGQPNSATFSKKKKKKKSIVNGFTAFRLYHSIFAKTYRDQEVLSSDLARYWSVNPKIQDDWRGYSEEYKVFETDLPFAEWFNEFKAETKVERQPKQEIRQKSTLSHMPVEDIYMNMELHKGSK